ncbi:hypothetical protein ACU8KH_05569 [Lachancea thermotolerans]
MSLQNTRRDKQTKPAWYKPTVYNFGQHIREWNCLPNWTEVVPCKSPLCSDREPVALGGFFYYSTKATYIRKEAPSGASKTLEIRLTMELRYCQSTPHPLTHNTPCSDD